VLRRSVGLVAVALLAAACTSGGPAAKGTTTRVTTTTTSTLGGPPPVLVDQAVTPSGWVPVDYGDVQISVPSDWYNGGICSSAHAAGWVYVGTESDAGCSPPGGPEGVPVVYLGPESASSGPMAAPQQAVNGIYFIQTAKALDDNTYFLQALGVSLQLVGAQAQAVLNTVTYSPRAAILPAGTASFVPSSWRRVSFAGLSFSAPASWPRETTDLFGGTCIQPGVMLFAPRVTLSSDTSAFFSACPLILDPFGGRAASDGIQVDEIPSRATPTPSGLSTNCFHPHGLTACPYAQPAFGILYLLVTGPGLAHGVMFEVGLAGSGAVARTIIGSLQAA
jgi:hypothetical protein